MIEAPEQQPATKARVYWRESVKSFETPSWGRAIVDLVTSAFAYIALMVAMYLLVGDHPWLVLALSIPTAGFLLRTFIVFHDCGHGSFVPSARGNLWIGRFTALLVFQPFANWRHNHAVHHGTSGDLDRRGQGDVETLTVAEYQARDWKGRFFYRGFRSPFVLFTIGPLWSLMFGPRFWNKNMRPRQIHSVWLTNIALLILVGATVAVVGPVAWLLVQMPAAMLAGMGGVFLFYVQHQYEDAYWETGEQWDYADAALKGSSYLKLPKVLPLLQRQHRPPPRPPPERQDPQLQPAARPRREPDLRRRPGADLRRRGALAAAEADRPGRRPPADLARGARTVPAPSSSTPLPAGSSS